MRLWPSHDKHKYQNGSIFLILPRNYTMVKVIVDSMWCHDNNQIAANRDLKLKFVSIRKAKAEKEIVKTHTQI